MPLALPLLKPEWETLKCSILCRTAQTPLRIHPDSAREMPVLVMANALEELQDTVNMDGQELEEVPRVL